MFKYIIRRSLYSALIILGVIIITFVLFRVAAGSPEAVLLGKNPSPAEVEQLRLELGIGKPLFWGKWRQTEVFTGTVFDQERLLPSITVTEKCTYQDNSLVVPINESISLKRNFDEKDMVVKCVVLAKGPFVINGKSFQCPDWESIEVVFDDALPGEIVLKSDGSTCSLKEIAFFRKQSSSFDSQFFSSLGEIITFREVFPYVSFFNFGKTLITREEIRHILWRGMWPSLFLMVPIFFGELLLALVLAMMSTIYFGRFQDRLIILMSIAGMSISYLVFIIFGQWYLGYYFNFFPVWGYGGIRFLVLPIFIGIVSGLGGGVRFYRTVFINELNREYLRTARAKGCSSWTIYSKHLFKNALIPIITRASTIIPFLFTGSLLLERFFGIPGLGYAGVEALANSDLQMIKALVIVGAFIFVLINLIADITYAWADPRIRLE